MSRGFETAGNPTAPLVSYRIRHPEFQDVANPVLPGRGVSLANITDGRRRRFEYIYDLGDYWVHEIIVEEVLATDTTRRKQRNRS